MFRNVDRFASVRAREIRLGDMARPLCQKSTWMVLAFCGEREHRHCVVCRCLHTGVCKIVSQEAFASASDVRGPIHTNYPSVLVDRALSRLNANVAAGRVVA